MNINSIQRTGVLNPKGNLPSIEEAEQAAGSFEAMFLRTIINNFRESADLNGEGLFGESAGSNIKESWFDDAMSEHISTSGGVGLAKRLVTDWKDAGRIADAADAQRDLSSLPSESEVDRLMRAKLQGKQL
ncbi:MAG: hypothetical protein CSA62_09555 [Planctomycetota bacterium]|nr:MAG: hypothetical protein CSA62_09555 [Planctomycetota bacterium]